jgi:hypothetical protein
MDLLLLDHILESRWHPGTAALGDKECDNHMEGRKRRMTFILCCFSKVLKN